jgi:hypothetical protein
MQQLFKTRCTGGQFVVYDDRVAIEMKALGVDNSKTLFYKNITGVEVKIQSPKVPFLSAGAARLIVHSTGNQKLEGGFIKVDEAKKAQELIESKLSQMSQ